jgi:hypothetical protein
MEEGVGRKSRGVNSSAKMEWMKGKGMGDEVRESITSEIRLDSKKEGGREGRTEEWKEGRR